MVEVNGYSIEEDAAADDGSSSFCKSRDSEVNTTFFGIRGCRISDAHHVELMVACIFLLHLDSCGQFVSL